jgi:glycosyltransferase involved in cell wall biosynthesis
MPRLILGMIVKNEAAVIERCLRSALPFVDGCVIHDTGSTDGTAEKIIDILGDRYEPGGGMYWVHPAKWVNFSHNLNYVLNHIRGDVGRADDYVLRLDADMTLESDPRPHLDGKTDAYDVTVKEGSTYCLPLITRVGSDCHYVGRTHEWIEGQQSLGRVPVTVRHHGDGGCKADKFERDIRLYEGLTDPRSTFYRAQSYQCLRRHAEAARGYVARAGMNGWDEERWLAKHRAGECYRSLGAKLSAIEWFTKAWDSRPHRIEPLIRLSEMHREAQQFAAAAMVARKAVDVAKQPCTDRLFVEQWMYDWGADFEHSLARWYIGEKSESRATWERLLTRTDVTPNYRAAIVRNLTF